MIDRQNILKDIKRWLSWSGWYAKEAKRRNIRTPKTYDRTLRNMNYQWCIDEIKFTIKQLKDFI